MALSIKGLDNMALSIKTCSNLKDSKTVKDYILDKLGNSSAPHLNITTITKIGY